MKFGISAGLTSLAVIAMLVAACGGGGGSATAPTTTTLTPQAVVYVSLSTAGRQSSVGSFSFKVFNGPGATTTSGSAEPIGTIASIFGINTYNPANSVSTVIFPDLLNFPISTAPIVKIQYTWQNDKKVTFRAYSGAAAYAFHNITAVPIISRVDYFDANGLPTTPP